MFSIYDGRANFYQWDIDRKLIVEDETITQVHFCNRTDECSLVCETYQKDGLTLVNVPNVLLQYDWRINVYAYDTNYTKHCATFNVVKRSKPADYVYTETELKNWDSLVERMNEIDEHIEESVIDYLSENPPTMDMLGYAKKEYVDEQIAAIDIPEVDLSEYYTKTQTDAAIAKAATGDVDLTDYYTKAQTDAAIQKAVEDVAAGDVDLTDYYTKTETDAAIKKAVDEIDIDLTGYATEEYVRQQVEAIDIPETDLTGYYTKTETDTAISTAIGKIDFPETDLTGYYTKTEIDNKNYQTKAQVDQAISEAAIGAIEITEVYVGETEPTDEYVRIWINPNGTPDEIATVSYVEEVIGEVEDGAY